MTIKKRRSNKVPFGGLLVAGLALLVAGCQPLPPVTDAQPPTHTAPIDATPAPADTVVVETAAPTMTPAPAATGTAMPLTEETPMSETPSATPVYDPAMEPLVQRAVDDLAQNLGIAPDEITVVEAQGVVWPNTAMGCPQPDMMYTQVPQDGAFIRLKVDDTFYNYHYGGRRGLFLCEQAGKSGAPPSFDELQLPGGGGEDI